MPRILASALILVAVPFGIVSAAEPPSKAGIAFFEKHIRPMLVKHCYECHAADSEELGGNLRLDTRDGSRRGGEMGPAVVPKNVAKSLLVNAVEYKDLEMPPDEQLPQEAIAKLRRWIEMGAPDPRNEADTEAVAQTPTAETLWSLEPIKRSEPPVVTDKSWPRGDIDRFILAKIEANELHPVADAGPGALLRRVTFDLVGLPAAVEDVKSFSENPAPEFFADYVDRLLESPQFGERWARHWFDIARYAESAGSSRDALTPYAWRYRDYVIDALNADLPYDRFLTEQLAGDLLTADSPEERDRLQIATGLLAVGSKSLNGGNLEMNIVDDQIDVVGKAMMGLTISCARCHDHKFDPIPTTDYYALAGIFRSSKTLYGGGLKKSKNPSELIKTLIPLNGTGDFDPEAFADHNKRLTNLTKKHNAAAKRLQQLQARQKGKELVEKDRQQLADLKKVVAELKAELTSAQENSPPTPEFAMGVVEAKTQDCAVHIRGEADKLGEKVPRGFLSCVAVAESSEPATGQSGRLELARWITQPDHPLTSRVAVNRVWQHLFGRGLTTSVDNFGTSGLEPTHPRLLDHLAADFVQEGWSTKALIRKIVLSRTYQLSSDFDTINNDRDAENRYYWRMPRRRLESEAIRDAMLAVSGNLDLERPFASAVHRIGEGEVGRGINTKILEEPFPHRSVYLPIIRGIIPEMLKVFDFPEASNPKGQRDVSNVPTQSLFLMNSPFVSEQSASLADRVLQAADNNEQRVGEAFFICFSREPNAREMEASLAFLTQGDQAGSRERWVAWAQALLASAEFRFIE